MSDDPRNHRPMYHVSRIFCTFAANMNRMEQTGISIFQRPAWVVVFALAGGLAAVGIYIINKGKN